ncbi:MAG: PepSY domain-containing protein [Cyclobacteriaceae bacterium]|nr:PepSY domain-containing protein [Cyclobacteriaceae bacterium]
MNKSKAGILIVGILAFACSQPLEDNLQSFTNEVFSDLDISTIQNLETPYESTFNNSGGRSSGAIVNLADISTKLSEIFPDAEVLESEVDEERGLEIWEIKLKMPGGGILKVSVLKEIGEIIKMKGKSGPYTYEIDPGGSFISFSKAKELAFGAADGEISQWSLELEENNEWEYEFHIVGSKNRYEVEIKGFEGEVISVKEKQDDQDEDNDGEDEGDDEGDENDEEDGQSEMAPEEVVNFVQEYFSGDVIESERHHNDNGTTWKLYLENEQGAVVKFEVEESALEILKVSGEIGPFDYNIEISNNLISLQTAITKLFMEVDGELTQWELKVEEHDEANNWLYEFEVTSSTLRYEVEINAETGEIIKIEEED